MHDGLKVLYLAHAPKDKSITMIFLFLFSDQSKLASFEEINLTFGCLRIERF